MRPGTLRGVSLVKEWVESRGLKWRVIILEEPTRTVDEAARALGVKPEVIVKTLVLVCPGDRVLAAIIPGTRRLDLHKTASIAGECRLARPSEVERLTGYPVGGVPPVALPGNVEVVLDSSLLDKPIVYGGGGSQNALLGFSPRELVENYRVVVADVSK